MDKHTRVSLGKLGKEHLIILVLDMQNSLDKLEEQEHIARDSAIRAKGDVLKEIKELNDSMDGVQHANNKLSEANIDLLTIKTARHMDFQILLALVTSRSSTVYPNGGMKKQIFRPDGSSYEDPNDFTPDEYHFLQDLNRRLSDIVHPPKKNFNDCLRY